MAQIRSKLVARLTRSEYDRCQSLTLLGPSMMRERLHRERDRKSPKAPARAIMVIEDGQIVAWSLTYTDNFRERITFFFVHKDHRRKGYGRMLYKHARRMEGPILVCPSNQVNRSFFRSVGAKAASGWYW